MMKDQLKSKLMPLYEHLSKSVSSIDSQKAFFCAQWGRNFPTEKNTGLMFVGRATNGWVSDSDDVNVQFGEGEDAIFNRKDQMQWVENLEGENETYNTKKSAFWRVIKNTTKAFYPNNWSSHIVWSNVCKVAPWEGYNPNDTLYNAQLEDCQKILKTELEVFSPKVVVMLTGKSWSVDFLRYLNGNQGTSSIRTELWDGQYECKVYKIGDIFFIRSEHPQGKGEEEHVKCLTKLIKEYL